MSTLSINTNSLRAEKIDKQNDNFN